MTTPDAPAVGADWSGPSPKLTSLRLVEAGVGGIAVLVIVLVVERAASAGSAVVGLSALAVVGAAALAGVLLVRRARSWGYAERDEDLVVRRGLLVRRLSVIPYGRMQFIDVTAGPAERVFGLSTVRMHTAAAASDARIPGLIGDEAARLRDRLTVLGEARAAGL